MPIAVGALLFTLGAPLAVVNFIAIGVGAHLVWAGLGVGLNLLANKFLSPKQPVLKPSDVQTPIRQAVPPRIRSYGRVRIAGVVFWRFADVTSKTLYLGQLLNDGLIGGFVDYWIDKTSVSLDGSGYVTTAPYQTDSATQTQILTRLGLATETKYSQLNSVFGWDNVRADGIASILGIFHAFSTSTNQSQYYPGGPPLMRETIDSSVVWDWRDATQVQSNNSTWKASSNPVVCAMDFLMHFSGFGLPYSVFSPNLAQWTLAANYCDENFNGSPRYSLAFTYDYTQRPGDVLAQILLSCDGKVWPRTDATIGIRVGRFDGASKSLSSRNIRGLQLTYGQDALTSIAGVRANYLSPAKGYVEIEATPWPTAAIVAALDQQRVVTMPLTMVPSEAQARRLMEIEYLRQTSPRRLMLDTDLAAIALANERWFNLSIPERGINGVFEILDLTLDVEGNPPGCRLQVAEYQQPSAIVTSPTAFQFAGQGIAFSTFTAPAFNYSTVRQGRAPAPGDFVVWVMEAEFYTGTYTLPAGWTEIGHRTDATDSNTYCMFGRIVTSADLSAAINPFVSDIGNAGDSNGIWVAFQNPPAGVLSSSLYSDMTAEQAGPPPVVLDARVLTGPLLALSMHTTVSPSTILASPSWTGETPDGSAFLANPLSGKQLLLGVLWKLYPAGTPGTVILATMNETSSDWQAIGELHIT